MNSAEEFFLDDVGVMPGRSIVEAQPAKITFVFNKPSWHAAIQWRFMQPDPVFRAAAHVDAMRTHNVQSEFVPVDERVQRQHHPHIVAELLERFGQPSHNVAETANLGERRALGRDEQNLHWCFSGHAVLRRVGAEW